jgi:hypothetical protein
MKKQLVLLPYIASSFHYSDVQKDPEFIKNQWVLYQEGHQGLAINFTSAPNVYVGGIRLCPLIALVRGKLRIDAVAGALLLIKILMA